MPLLRIGILGETQRSCEGEFADILRKHGAALVFADTGRLSEGFEVSPQSADESTLDSELAKRGKRRVH